MLKGRDKRQPIKCNSCGSEMVFGKEVWMSTNGATLCLRYVCPHRIGERGCGQSRVVELQRTPGEEFKRAGDNIFTMCSNSKF